MKSSTLESLAPLLDLLRAHPALKEVRPAAFYLDGRDFLHFHEEPDGLVADVRLTKGFVRMSVSNHAEQTELLERINQVLESLELREHKRGQQK